MATGTRHARYDADRPLVGVNMDSIADTTAQTDLDFFWQMMGAVNGLVPIRVALEELHEEAVDDACATFMAGQEL